jgi:predicted ABC-type ATPase
MDYARPTLLVISGPNGAGKSTYIQSMLPEEFTGIWSFNRDEIRVGFENQLISNGAPKIDRLKIATVMMESKLVSEMKKAISNEEHFVLETPLSDPYYWTYINLFEDAGYQVQLNYLCLDTIEHCKARVQQRVSEGGHAVSPETIKGVYNMNLEHMNGQLTEFARLEFYDGAIMPTMLCAIDNNQVEYLVPEVFKKSWIKKGLPVLHKMLKEAKV